MLVFVVPLKSQQVSTDWELVSRLLERTLKSICNQTSSQFEVVVVCNERPEILFTHPKIHYVEVDFPPPVVLSEEQARLVGYEHVHSQTLANKHKDQAQKQLKGIEYAARFNPTHVMMVDADDCISCHLAEFVSKHPDHDAWCFQKGYIYREGSRFVYIKNSRFNHVCGTSYIIRYPLHQLLFQGDYNYHCSVDELPNANVKPLPFKGALYSMLNGENILMSASTFTQMRFQVLRNIPKLIDRLMRYRVWWLTDKMIQEFGLYPIRSTVEQS